MTLYRYFRDDFRAIQREAMRLLVIGARSGAAGASRRVAAASWTRSS